VTFPTLAVNVAFDSDPLDDTPTNTDITNWVTALAIDTGRQQEVDDFQAGTLAMTLDNSDRRFDPRHTTGPYFGKLNPRKRVTVGAGAYLSLPGVDNARATCPDHPQLDITGDIDLRACIRMNDWTPTADFGFAAIIGKYTAALATYGLFVTSTGLLTLAWRTSGGTNLNTSSTIATGFTDGTTHWIRATLDVDNGAGQRVLIFYTSDDPPSTPVPAWTQLGATVTQAGTTSIQSNSTTGFVGAIDNIEEWAGRFYKGEIRNGIGGTVVGSPDFTVANADGTSYRDGQNNVWSVQGTADIVADPTVYPRFTGFMEGWPQSGFRPPETAVMDVGAIDIFGLLANIPVGRSVYAIEVDTDTPRLWFPLGEEIGTKAVELVARNDADYTKDPKTIATDGLIRLDPGRAMRSESDMYVIQNAPFVQQDPAKLFSASIMTVELWLVLDVPTQPSPPIIFTSTLTELHLANTFRLQIVAISGDEDEPYWELHATAYNTTRIAAIDANPLIALDGDPHHLVVVFDTSGGSTSAAYLDGVVIPGATWGHQARVGQEFFFPMPTANYLTVAAAAPESWNEHDGTFDEVALYDHSLNAARAAAHRSAGTTPWSGDSTGARVGRILDLCGVGTADRAIDTGVITLGPTALATDALSYLKSIERTEAGQFYWAHQEGKLRFRDRYQNFNNARSTTSQANFSDDPADSGAVRVEPESVQIVRDEQLIWNEVTVNWDAGSNTASDAASITAHGRRSKPIDTRLKSSLEAQALAEWIVDRYKDPIDRIRSLTIRPSADWTQFSRVMGLRIGDRVTFRFHPQSVGAAMSFPLLIEGIHDRIGNGVNDWEITFDLSPADTAVYARWDTAVWDTDKWAA
jgi:hypothetical protein